MFAPDPVEALRRVRECLVAGGILAASAWGPLEGNPGQRLRLEAARPFLAAPPPDPDESADPMRFGRPGLLAALFRRAGFRRVRAEATPVCGAYPSVEDYIRVVRDTSLVETYRALSRADRNRLDERLRRRFRRFEDGACVRVPGLAWVVSGRR